MALLRREQVIVAQEMVARDVPVRQIARDIGAGQSTLRYHVARGMDAPDGRRDRPSIMDAWQARVTAVLQRFDNPRTGGDSGHYLIEAAVVHGVNLPHRQQTGGAALSRADVAPPRAPGQSVRRGETLPVVGTVFRVAGVVLPIHGLLGTLSHARARFFWVSARMDQLAWLSGNVGLFPRHGGVPPWARIDNLNDPGGVGGPPNRGDHPGVCNLREDVWLRGRSVSYGHWE